ncbi:MAG: 3-hydroxyacyl-CoA dehydrogenase NAD-binding domain-containing protein [Rhodobacteraceae bacterium]|nr:3-hydroxyacyl-CoA dehydrogenase NAD-binding domain-containing protein [Paracoccaceae bacterium]
MIDQHVVSRQTGQILEVTIRNPPVNALSAPVRAGLFSSFEAADRNRDIKAVLLRAEGRTFPAGADIKEFGKSTRPPSLPELCDRVEAVSKPVIAVMHGTVLGGGLELALAAHFRIAAPGTKIGFPEIKLGLIPGAGGTQRTPRICGAGISLELMLSGDPTPAQEALSAGLVDRLSTGELDAAALEYARALIAEGAPPRPTGERSEGFGDRVAYAEALQAARQQLQNRVGRLPAHERIINSVATAAKLPLAQGLAFERQGFIACLGSAESKALRHAFFAERAAPKWPAPADVKPHAVQRIAVIGGGLMGSGIATACLAADLTVELVEVNQAALGKAVERVESVVRREVQRGRSTAEEAERRISALTGHAGFAKLGQVDFAIEAVSEDLPRKQAVYPLLAERLAAGTVIATNTSYLDVNQLARCSGRNADFIGMHFFAPAHLMRLVEIIRARESSDDAVATAAALARRLGKTAVHAGMCEGFIGNRLLIAYREAADLMLLDGASPYEIDQAWCEFGYPIGIYAAQDLSGLDISWARRQRMLPQRNPELRYNPLADRLCESGRLGQKSGHGYYLYGPERSRHEDPDLAELLESVRIDAGHSTPREFGRDEIQSRLLAAMVNEAARILDEGMAQRASDVDVVQLLGFGFPRWRGGPCHYADSIGLDRILRQVQAYAGDDPGFWQPSPLLMRMVRDGLTFAELNREADPVHAS